MRLTIAACAKEFGIKPLKKLGQNFIFDESLCDKIVRASGVDEQDNIIEVGPGPAGLTRSILKNKPKSLTLIETDERCIQLLEYITRDEFGSIINIIKGDALKINLEQISSNLHDIAYLDNSEGAIPPTSANYKFSIISNLPYNIGTKLLINWLKSLEYINSMTLMLQREVAERIVAKVSTKEYGRLSVLAQLLTNANIAFDVGPQSFYPPPKVHSSIILLKPREDRPNIKYIKIVEKITNMAFSQRRKKIKTSLKSDSHDIISILNQLNIDPSIRAEDVSPSQYLAISKLLEVKENE